ncbi:MAG: sigma 54-interacting transcriptional regulator, partial [Methyloversatilis sp.]|nr:sigma 54-interacting transcriptional regulator [Methyloversatilis sp.]
VAYGLTRSEIARGCYAHGEGVTGRVMQTGEPQIVQDIDDEPRYLARAVTRATLPEGTVSYLVLPVRIGRRLAGVLGVHRLRSRKRSLGADLEVLRTVADLIGQIYRIHELVEKRTADLQQENRELKAALEHRAHPGANWGIVGESPQLMEALTQLEQVSATDATVLLLGESGTGKELFARALHLQSLRRDQPFVKVNCAAIPETLFESELFGHEKGAFTGAAERRIGRLEQASGGTLFLDEIGDLPLPVQVKLLRALQERVIERLGGRGEIAVDVRIVAATHQDLMALVQGGSFRLDLFYRLNVIPIRLPSLRERPGDIRQLVRFFVSQLNQRHQRNVSIATDALARLEAYAWPGNIRQLYNVLERIVLLSRGDLIDLPAVQSVLTTETHGTGHAATAAAPAEPTGAPAVASAVRGYRPVEGDEAERIRHALVQHRGNKSRAARSLDMTLRQLDYRVRLLGIDVAAIKQQIVNN